MIVSPIGYRNIPIYNKTNFRGQSSNPAQNINSNVNLPKESLKIPEFLYHMTPRESYKKIIDSKMLIPSKRDYVPGIYFFDKKTFLYPIFPLNTPITHPDIILTRTGQYLPETACLKNHGASLFAKIGSIDNSAILLRIPTKFLDLDKLKIRSYKEAFDNNSIYKIPQKLISEAKDKKISPQCFLNYAQPYFLYDVKGHDISELNKYIDNDDILEYIYQDTLPVDLFKIIGEVDITQEDVSKLRQNDLTCVKKLYEKIMQGDNS